MLKPNIPVVNPGLKYINGMQLSMNAGGVATYVDISAGACRDYTNTNDIILRDGVTVSLKASGARGIDVGVVEADTLYAVYAVASSADPFVYEDVTPAFPATVVLSKSFERPVLPYGYDMYRRIGAVATNSAEDVKRFVQVGTGTDREVRYVAHVGVIQSGNETAFAAVSTNTSVPPLKANVIFSAALTGQAAGNTAYLSVSGIAASIDEIICAQVAGVEVEAILRCPQTELGLFYKVSNVGDSLILNVAGYVDYL